LKVNIYCIKLRLDPTYVYCEPVISKCLESMRYIEYKNRILCFWKKLHYKNIDNDTYVYTYMF